MNQQDELGARIGRLLAESTESVTPEQRERLAAARRQALARQQSAAVVAPAMEPAWAGAFSRFTEQNLLGVRYLVPVAALVFGLFGVVYMHTGTVPSEIAEVDVGLLTDELPINAFLDQNLDSWLKSSPR